MALFNINASAIGETIGTTAIGKAAQALSESLSPKMVRDVQKVLDVGRVIGQYTGIKTGVGLIDGLLNLTGGNREEGTRLLGGLSLRQAQAMHDNLRLAHVARKNLFFIRITDENPPVGVYASPEVNQSLGLSRIGAGVNDVIKGIAGGVASVAGTVVGPALGNFVSGVAGSAVNRVASTLGVNLGGVSDTNGIGRIAVNSFDMLALDVSYGMSIVGDHQALGGTFFDRPTSVNPIEFQVTTMDDEAGSIKRWFEGKFAQVVSRNGTVGLPSKYLFTIEIVHAIASPDVANERLAYRKFSRVRAASGQFDLSRRDQALAEVVLTFAELDPFMGNR